MMRNADLPPDEKLKLLRRYEPVVRYTHGELFFPCAVEPYIQRCSLWLRAPDGGHTQLAKPGELTVVALAEHHHIPPGHTLYLRFVQEPLESLAYQRWRRRPDVPRFYSSGRLARVGLGSRVLDSFFNLSLLVRGKVPGGTAAQAHLQYREIRQQDPRYVYYARVLREGGYIVLHYLYFYAMNNWRSMFYGVNDHEADWEQVFVYLSDEVEPQPQWVAYAAHDYSGDHLRRRWDDPGLLRVDGTHPVVFAGAGSHASYFEQGEYLAQFRLSFLEPVYNGVQTLREFWVEQLGQGAEEERRLHDQIQEIFSIPFVDYARGDGLAIGQGQPQRWAPRLLDGEMTWVDTYRGLWGLDTRDPFGGERAPAGPKYNRDGTVRQSWHNPLGWSGLHKVPPRHQAAYELRRRIRELERDLTTVNEQITAHRTELRTVELEVRALRAAEYLDALYDQRSAELERQVVALDALYSRAAALKDTLGATRQYLAAFEQGDYGDPRAHLVRMHRPSPQAPQFSRLVELWAAISTGLLLLAFAALIFFDTGNWVPSTLVILLLFFVIEATLRSQLASLLLTLTIMLAMISAGVLFVEFFPLVLLTGLLLLARLLIVENLREFRGQ